MDNNGFFLLTNNSELANQLLHTGYILASRSGNTWIFMNDPNKKFNFNNYSDITITNKIFI